MSLFFFPKHLVYLLEVDHHDKLIKSGHGHNRCPFMAYVLNGPNMLFCPFDQRNPHRAWLVDQLHHVFAYPSTFAQVYTCTNFIEKNCCTGHMG